MRPGLVTVFDPLASEKEISSHLEEIIFRYLIGGAPFEDCK